MSTDAKARGGLKTIVRVELALRGKTWDKKAPQAVPNKRASKKLEARRKAWDLDSKGKIAHQRTRPGSYNLKQG